MQTRFSPAALADPEMATSEAAIRKCVHCGFCTATCPTYVLLGDELDSPRGRIYLMKGMLEAGEQPTRQVVKHVDRCLSCLSCTTTCPSGVDYMHLVDHARSYIEERYRRPWPDRVLRYLLAKILPSPMLFRAALSLARMARPFAPLVGRLGKSAAPLKAMLDLAPTRRPKRSALRNGDVKVRRGRVILMGGCAEPVLRPSTQEAAVRLLNRGGYDVVFASEEGCCGALVHHMGRREEALVRARRNIDAWEPLLGTSVGAILVTASGCGTAVKDYGHLLKDDPAYAARAARVAALVQDVSEFVAQLDVDYAVREGTRVAYHPACSLQHGQKLQGLGERLLARAGFEVSLPRDAHLCCGSAGTYNILQPELAGALGDRKAAAIAALAPDVIATGNIGCAVQIGRRTEVPVVHTIELLDWASGGPKPIALGPREEA